MVPGFWPRVGEESSDAREGRFEQHLVGYDKAIAGNGANIFRCFSRARYSRSPIPGV